MRFWEGLRSVASSSTCGSWLTWWSASTSHSPHPFLVPTVAEEKSFSVFQEHLLGMLSGAESLLMSFPLLVDALVAVHIIGPPVLEIPAIFVRISPRQGAVHSVPSSCCGIHIFHLFFSLPLSVSSAKLFRLSHHSVNSPQLEQWQMAANPAVDKSVGSSGL